MVAVSVVPNSWEGWRAWLPCCQLSCCAARLHALSPLLCTLTSAALALHSLQCFPERWDSSPRPCSVRSLKRLMRCPLDTCNTGAHVFKKPGAGDIPWACCWLSFPCSHSPPQEGCKFGRSCIISRPTLSHVSPATSLSVTPSCWPHSLPPSHLPLWLPAVHPAGFLDRPRTLSWHGHAWKWVCGYPCMPTAHRCTVTYECGGVCARVCPRTQSGCLEVPTAQGSWLHMAMHGVGILGGLCWCLVSPTAVTGT